MNDNAANPAIVKPGRRRDKRGFDLYRVALRHILKSSEARLVLANWLDRADIYRPALGNESPTALFFEAGRRSFGLEIMQELESADRSLFDLLLAERRERASRAEVDDALDREAAATEEIP